MGIYASEHWERDTHSATFTSDLPGLTTVRVYEQVAEFEFRTDCFCCSCPAYHLDHRYLDHDPYCRNHGFAGQRPCDVHGMPGQPGEAGVMPHSVQVEIARLIVGDQI